MLALRALFQPFDEVIVCSNPPRRSLVYRRLATSPWLCIRSTNNIFRNSGIRISTACISYGSCLLTPGSPSRPCVEKDAIASAPFYRPKRSVIGVWRCFSSREEVWGSRMISIQKQPRLIRLTFPSRVHLFNCLDLIENMSIFSFLRTASCYTLLGLFDMSIARGRSRCEQEFAMFSYDD